MAIIGSLPVILTNGTIADATQVMADFNYIVTQVNANGSPATGGAYLPLTGGILSGQLTISMPVTTGRNLIGQTSGSNRWIMALGDSTGEGGSNAGSDFQLFRCSDAGSAIDAPLAINRASGAVAIRGTQTNDNAAAGMVGEFQQANGTSSVLASNSPLTIASSAINLPAGDWDAWGTAWFTPSVSFSAVNVGISTALNTLPTTLLLTALNIPGMGAIVVTTPMTRISAASSTLVYLTVQCNFTGTATAIGSTYARRRR
jgi:hypothetical protein